MNTSIVYVMSGSAHTPYLTTSLYSLRKHWDGEIIVYAFPESQEIVEQICKDKRIRAEFRTWEPERTKKNQQFVNKILIAKQLDRPRAIYLDADTMPVGSLKDITETLDSYPFVPTQFNNWLACEGLPANRIGWLKGREGIPQEAVERALSKNRPLPSVNGGVFGFWPGSQILEKWERYTRAALDLFIADEIALHALVAEHWNTNEVRVVIGGHVNCSPKFKPKYLPDKAVSVYHGHGDCWTRPDKCSKGVYLWRRCYQECLELNLGSIQDWKSSCGNKWLKQLEEHSEKYPEDCGYCWGNPTEGHSKTCPLN